MRLAFRPTTALATLVASSWFACGARSSVGSDRETANASAPALAPVFVPDAQAYRELVEPYFRRHCIGCHGPDAQEGEFRIDQLLPDLSERHVAEKWLEVVNRINKGEMPPADEPRPDAKQQDAVATWIAGELRRAAKIAQSTGGKIVLRRMNRAEYNNTIRDLIGMDFSPAADFPEDPPAFGFDNVGSALSISPLHFEKYLRAAREIVDRAIVSGERPKSFLWRLEVEQAHPSNQFPGRRSAGDFELWVDDPHTPRHRYLIKGGGRDVQDGWLRQTGGRGEGQAGFRWFKIPAPGEYVVRIRAAAHIPTRADVLRTATALKQAEYDRELTRLDSDQKRQQLRERWDRYVWPAFRRHLETYPDYDYGAPRMKVATDKGIIVGEVSVDAPRNEPHVYEFRYEFHPQPRELDGINVTNNYAIPREIENLSFGDNPGFARPELWIDWVELEGPVVADWPLPSQRRLLFDSPLRDNETSYAREVLDRFASRAYRRPATTGEIDGLLELLREVRASKPNFEEAIKIPLIAVLCSPHFLYLVEPSEPAENTLRELDEWELASRLSYFLWSSMPDEELFALARAGTMHDPDTLRAQVDRMLADPKSAAFVRNFTGQWLGLRQVGANPPGRDLFPRYDDHLETSMVGESEAFFAEILHHDLDVKHFLKSDFVVINERLARFYAIPDVKGDKFRRVPVDPQHHRGGLLTQASILTITSNGTRTSPVIRGKWILDNILGDPPPPPPPDAGDIAPKVPGINKATVRVRLEAHRQIAACASCHSKIDPLGFALENFNADGTWRDREGFGYKGRIDDQDPPIDASGTLPDGTTFATFEEFRELLLHREDEFLAALTEKLTTYALGRGIEYSDRPTLEEFRRAMKREGNSLRSLIRQIVTSRLFLTK